MSDLDDLIAKFGVPEYTQAQFKDDRARLLAILCAKHGIDASEVDALIGEHRYRHSAEDPEDEYMGIMALGCAAGWIDD